MIGTPGRLEDILAQRLLVLSQCEAVILDEADKMIEMDLEEAVNNILDHVPESENKVFSMFSATMVPAVAKLAKQYLR